MTPTTDQRLAELRRQVLTSARTFGDLERNLALWLAVRMGTPREASSFNIDSSLAVDRERLDEAPYLAAVGFIAAIGERIQPEDEVVDALRRVLQRQPHTLEGEGFADDALVFCGLALLAESLRDSRAIAATDRAARDVVPNEDLVALIFAVTRQQALPACTSALCVAIEHIIRRAGRDNVATVPEFDWSQFVTECEAATGLAAMLHVAVLEHMVAVEPTSLAHMKENTSVDIVLLIALREEFRVLHSRIKSEATPVEEDGQHYYLFDIPSEAKSYRCVATFVGEMGTTFSGPVTQKAITHWKPKTVVSIGIAAGIHKDVRIGDALVATQVDAYLDGARANASTSESDGDRTPAPETAAIGASEKAKTPDGSKFDLATAGNSFQADSVLVGRARNFEFVHPSRYEEWRTLAERRRAAIAEAHQLPDSVRARPELADGHLACGPIVGASTAFTNWLHKRDRSYRALQMESSAVMACAHLSTGTKAFVIRGISDFGDERKTDLDQIGDGVLREYAMQNALDLLWALAAAKVFDRHDEEAEPALVRPIPPRPTSAAAGGTLPTASQIKAAQILWATILAMRDAMPLGLLNYFDIHTDVENARCLRSEEAMVYVDRFDDASIMAMTHPSVGKDLELHRPTLGEATWSKFVAYRAFLGRVCFVIRGKLGGGKPWSQDKATVDQAASAIGASALHEIMQRPVGRINAVRALFEADMAKHLGPFLSAGA